MNASEEQMLRALTLSHLTSVYIKQSLGRLSALCGCVVASTGASTAITWLMGGGYEDACAAVKIWWLTCRECSVTELSRLAP